MGEKVVILEEMLVVYLFIVVLIMLGELADLLILVCYEYGRCEVRIEDLDAMCMCMSYRTLSSSSAPNSFNFNLYTSFKLAR